MSRKRAHPLRALLRTDRRMLWRHGIVALYAFLAAWYVVLLRFLIPEAERARFTALLLLTDPAAMSLFFMGAVVLYEKNQHIHAALYACGVRAGSYVLSKCVASGALGTLAGCAILWFSDPRTLIFQDGLPVWQSLLNGDLTALCVTAACMLAGGVLFTCLSLLPASLAHSLNGFIIAGGLCELLLLAPAAVELFYPLPEVMGFHPAVLLARALWKPHMAAAWLREPMFQLQTAALFGYIILSALLAKGCAARMLRGKGGVAQ